MTLDKNTYTHGLYDVSVTNLPLAECCDCTEEFGGQMVFVPRPKIDIIEPDALSVVDGARNMEVEGKHFLLVDNEPSELFLLPQTTPNTSGYFASADACTSLTIQNHNLSHTADLCERYTVEVPKAPTQEVDRATTRLGSVHAEDRCTSDAALLLFPAPAIFDVFPPAVCVGQKHKVTLAGQNFLVVNGRPPRVFLKFNDGQIDDQVIPENDVVLQGCLSSDIQSAYQKRKISKCDKAEIQFDATVAKVGLFTVRIENPAPILGSDAQTVSGKIQVVAKPQLFSINSALVCSHQNARTLDVSGVGLASLDDVHTSLTIDGAEVTLLSRSQCTSRNTTNRDSNVRVSTCARYTIQVKQLSPAPAALYPKVATTHPGSTGGYWQSTELLLFYPAPVSTKIAYPVVCADNQDQQTITITGAKLLVIDAAKPTVTIDGVAKSATDVQVSNCVQVPGVPRLSVQECTTLVVSVSSKTTIPVKTRSVSVTNPTEAAGCTATKVLEFRVVGKPEIQKIDQVFMCRAGGALPLEVQGVNFVMLNGRMPTFQVDGKEAAVKAASSCTSIPIDGHALALCSTIIVEILKNDAKEISVPLLSASSQQNQCTAPACNECRSLVSKGLLTFTTPPSIAAFFPAVCATVDRQDFALSGANLLFVNNKPPQIKVGGVERAVKTKGSCATIGTKSQNALMCKEATLQLDNVINGFTTGQAVSITNQDGCSVRSAQKVLKDTRAPRVDNWSPQVLCSDLNGQTLDLNGFFPRVSGINSVVFLSGKLAKIKATSSCSSDDCGFIKVETPSGMAFGNIKINVKAACEADTIQEVKVLPTPSISSTTPDAICETKKKDVTFTGKYMIPSVKVTLNGKVWVADTSNCALENSIEVCKTLKFTVDVMQLKPGFVTAELDNGNAACKGTFKKLEIIKEPVITSVTEHYCYDTGGDVTVKGNYFRNGETTVWLVGGGKEYKMSTMKSVKASELVANFKAEYLPAGVYTVKVQNGPDCVRYGAGTIKLRVHPKLFALFVDPLIVYNGIRTDVAIFTSGLLSQAKAIEFTHANKKSVKFDKTNSNYVRAPIPLYNRIRAVLPAKLDAGNWKLSVTSEIGCKASLDAAATVTSVNSIVIDSVDPQHFWTTTGGALSIFSSKNPGSGKVNFVSLPTVYITPSNTDAKTSGVALTSVALLSATLITAAVPAGLEPGTYDVVIVDMANKVAGVKQKAVVVTANQPPVVHRITPGSVVQSSTTKIAIQGEAFDTKSIKLTFTCTVPGSSSVKAYDFTNGITFKSSARIEANIGGSVTQFSVCVVTVQNGDGSKFDYSAVTSVNSARKLAAPAKSATKMLEARRGHGLVGAQVTTALSYLWVIGGDSGQVSNAKKTVEAASISKFGELSVFTKQRNELPQPITFGVCTRIGDFIYVAGGHTGSAFSNKVYRANILSPRHTVALDVTINVGLVATAWPLKGGFYFYRVSAVFGNSDGANPGGESLPGDYLSIRFPKSVANLAALITWKAVPGAAKYRLYRTKAANDKASELQLLAEVPAPADATATVSYNDLGAAPVSTATPLPDGSLGTWSVVGTLPAGTVGASSAVVHVGQSGNVYHLFVMGGQANLNRRDGGSTAVHTCTVTRTPANGLVREQQAVAGCDTPTPNNMPAGFNFGGVSAMTAAEDGIAAGTKTLLVAAGGMNLGNVRGAYHSGTPILGSWSTGSKMNSQGHCQFNANGFLYMLGGGTQRDGWSTKTANTAVLARVSHAK